MQWLPPDEYISLLEQSGMSDVNVTQERVTMTLDGISFTLTQQQKVEGWWNCFMSFFLLWRSLELSIAGK